MNMELFFCEDVFETFNDTETVKMLCEIPEIAQMREMKQDTPYHCYDLWNHTLHTISGITHDLPVTEEEWKELRIAAFFHDIGKTVCKKRRYNKKFGRETDTFHGHPYKSVSIAERILSEWGYPYTERELFLIRQHDMFMNCVLPSEDRINESSILITPKNIMKMVKKCRKHSAVPAELRDFVLLTYICDADGNAQAPEVYDCEGVLIHNHKILSDRIGQIRQILCDAETGII